MFLGNNFEIWNKMNLEKILSRDIVNLMQHITGNNMS